MTQRQIEVIAKSLGRQKDQPDIDEHTRIVCVNAVCSAIQDRSKLLDKTEDMKKWRTLARLDE